MEAYFIDQCPHGQTYLTQSQSLQGRFTLHFDAIRSFLEWFMRCVAGTVSLVLVYRRSGPLSPLSIAAFADADWGGSKDTRKSTTVYFIAINEAPIF